MKTRHLLHTALILSAFSLQAFRLFGQQVAQPPPPAGNAPAPQTTTPPPATAPAAPADIQTNDAGEVIQMSAFNVAGERDTGYAGGNTVSGSRVKTDLKDIAASIDPFTEEFLNDIGATTIDDIMTYAGNAESEYEDTQGFNNLASRGATSGDDRFRLRGMPMTRTVDFFTYPVATDIYNSSRAEISSGANAILAGLGQAGGIINVATKRADAQRNRLRVKGTIGTWTSPAVSGIPYRRAELDYNIVLMPKILGLRLMGLYEEGTKDSWRKYMTGRDKRINPVIYIKPFQNTTINARYETGRIRQSTSYNWNVGDRITGWLALPEDERVMAGFGSAYALPKIDINGTIINPTPSQVGNSLTPVFVNNNNTMYDARQTYYTGFGYVPGPNENANQYRLPASLSSYYYNPVGPSGYRDQKFDNATISIEQRIGPVDLELAFHHDSLNAIAHAPSANGGYANNNNDAMLRGDPNAYISAGFAANPQNTGVVQANPFAGGMYLEDNWSLKTTTQRNNDIRLTANYTLNLKNFGAHRLVGFLERWQQDITTSNGNEVLIDENQNLLGGTDLVRRQYVTPGDFSTYYDGDWRTPITDVEINGHLYHNGYVGDSTLSHSTRIVNSAMAVLQSFWLKGALVTTLGIRLDAVTRRLENISPVTDPNDPRILNKTLTVGEYALDGTYRHLPNLSPHTYSAGAVYHLPILKDRVSLFANYSTNRGLPANDTATVLPDGLQAPVTQGRSIDYGVMLDPLGNGKIFIRATRFDSKSYYNLTQNTGGTGTTIGNINMLNIYAALNTVFPGQFTNPPYYTAGLSNTVSSGYEITLTANPTKNFTLRASFSYSDRMKEGNLQEIVDFYNANIPVWMKLADPAQNGGIDHPLTFNTPTGTWSGSLYDFIWQNLYSTNAPPATFASTAALVGTNNAGAMGIRPYLDQALYNNSGPLASRPYKFNIRANYKFDKNTFLRGFAIGGGLRYSSPNYTIDPFSPYVANLGDAPADNTIGLDPNAYSNTKAVIKGNTLLFWDGVLSYKCKLFSGRTTMTLQLNVNNIFNQCVITMGRTTVNGVWTRVYLNAPRTYRLSATFDF